MKKTIIAALLAATCAIATSASAETIRLDGSFGSNLSTKTYDAVFKSNLTEKFDVNSLSFSFTFKDFGTTDWTYGNAYNATNGKLSDYSYNLFDLRWDRGVTNTQHVDKASQQETATLMFGNTELKSGGTTKKTGTEDGFVDNTTSQGVMCRYFIVCGTEYTTTTTKTTYHKTDYTGPFTISGVIDDKNIIDQLIGTGELALSLNIFGNLKLTGGGIDLDYTTKVDAPAEVPEPSSLLLAGLGLAAVGFARRRRSSAAKA